jgi:hypothetical protein
MTAEQNTDTASTEQVYTDGGESFAAALDAAFAGLDSTTSVVGGVEFDSYDQPDAPETKEAPEAPVDQGSETPGDAPEEMEVQDSESDPDDAFTDWTPKAANRFKQLKSELKEYKQEAERLQQATKEYEARVAELDALAARNDPGPLEEKLREYEKDMMFRDLESTDIYRRTIEEPITQIMESVSRIAEENRLDVDALVDILSLDDPRERKTQLGHFLVGVPDQDKIEVYMAARDLDPLMERRNSLFENVNEALNEAKMLDENHNKEILAQRAIERQEISSAVVNKVKEKLPFLKVAEGVDFAAIERKAADLDPSVADPVDVAFGAVAAQLVPVLVREYAVMRKEVEALTDKLAEYDSAEPTLSGRTSESSGAGISSSLSFEDALNAALGSY